MSGVLQASGCAAAEAGNWADALHDWDKALSLVSREGLAREDLARCRNGSLFCPAVYSFMLNNCLQDPGVLAGRASKRVASHLRDCRCKVHEVYEARAQVLLELGKVFDAIQAATRSTEVAPSWVAGFLTLARAQVRSLLCPFMPSLCFLPAQGPL